ncbi:MAG: SGNH/GDSL hydrolase family protein [Clostridiales bacterium]|jgi:lysophospholipase L1-like esterase|nr:SGNH/GDSL hydrolase family protein [Clostridiales bacterium]
MRQLFHNTARVVHTEEGYQALRFSDAQLAHYAQMSDGARIRSMCTASVKLDFCTTADEITLDFLVRDFSRPYVGIDVYEDGRLTRHQEYADRCESGTLRYICMGRGCKRVELYLSCLNNMIITGYDFGDAEPVEPYPGSLLILGDSITQGMTVKCPSLCWASLLGRKWNMETYNMGVGGAKYDAAHLDGMDLSPTRILVAYGINDLSGVTGTDGILQNADVFLKKLRAMYPGVPTTVMTPIWNARLINDAVFAELFTEYCGALTKLAQGYGCTVADGLTLLPHDSRHLFDGAHPNEEGSALMALALA